jgi:predicted CxxxxCH...CXXCH cytochrome family protein
VVVFPPGTLATTQNAVPTFDGATLTCSSTYCHGNFRFDAVTGNAGPTPAWTSTAPLGCTGCHGMPPTGHQALSGTVTAAACAPCHPQTVKADGSIDVGGGTHINGLAEFQGGHTDPDWANPTHHGYQASAGGLQACTGCHVAFGAASGVASSSCNGCHSAGSTAWQTNCTFCHGTAGRTGNLTGTDARLAAAPPVGSQGETATTQVAVGAHQGHVNPPASGALSNPFACTVCHPSPLPADVAHVDGQPTPVQFSGVAVGGTYNRTASPTCSSTYCHGNFAGGNAGNSPSWTAASVACNSCHAIAPNTGEHGRNQHVNAGCGACHSGYTSTTVNAGSHVNGEKNVNGTRIQTWIAGTRSCTPTSGGGCHGTETW